ncbi:MAG: dihydroorotate dehydrogenase [Thermodesulfobacteriota bacterium]
MAKLGLSVDIGGVRIKNPVMTASGTFGYGEEFSAYTDITKLGAVVVKGLSPQPREGNPPLRTVETPCGMLNAIGLQNVGVDAFIKEKMPFLRKQKVPVIANIFGETVAEYKLVAAKLDGVKGVKAVEINISCPNVKRGGVQFGTDPKEAARVVRAVKKATSLPVMTKLSPNVTDIKVMARAVEDAGTDSISLINTITGMVVDTENRRPVLATATGGLSGPAIRPVAVRMVYEVAGVVNVPVIGMGGIMSAEDALQFIIAGATAVQVGTASFVDPDAAVKVLKGIEGYMAANGVRNIKSLIGSIER